MKIPPRNPTPNEILETVTRLIAMTKWSHWSHLARNENARRNLITFMEKGCPRIDDGEIVVHTTLSDGEELARGILGKDFLTIAQAEQVNSFSFTESARINLALTVPNSETLVWLQNEGYVLTPTLSEDCHLLQYLLQYLSLSDPGFCPKVERWFARAPQAFSRKDVMKSCRWLAVRKELYPQSQNKPLRGQRKLLTAMEYVPSAVEMMYVIGTYYKVHGVCLFKKVRVRTSSVDVSGQSVLVGDTNIDGPKVYDFSDNECKEYVGLSSALKLETNLDALNT